MQVTKTLRGVFTGSKRSMAMMIMELLKDVILVAFWCAPSFATRAAPQQIRSGICGFNVGQMPSYSLRCTSSWDFNGSRCDWQRFGLSWFDDVSDDTQLSMWIDRYPCVLQSLKTLVPVYVDLSDIYSGRHYISVSGWYTSYVLGFCDMGWMVVVPYELYDFRFLFMVFYIAFGGVKLRFAFPEVGEFRKSPIERGC